MVREHIKKISPRKKDSHKGDYGRVLVVAGSPGMTGASCLCAMGALRAGSGLVTCSVPESLNSIIEAKLTEVMSLPLEETKSGTFSARALKPLVSFSSGCDVVAIGPGLGLSIDVKKLVKGLLKEVEVPIVLDADGLNSLGGQTSSLKKRKAPTVITPHPGELARLVKKDIPSVQKKRSDVAKKVALDTGCVVVLKGHRTVVASSKGDTYVNETGNSGMATGGTGDVLTGMIASFIGQGIEAYSAAVSAVYLHGLAGDVAANEKGIFSLIASDIIESLPEAFKKAGI